MSTEHRYFLVWDPSRESASEGQLVRARGLGEAAEGYLGIRYKSEPPSEPVYQLHVREPPSERTSRVTVEIAPMWEAFATAVGEVP